MSSAIINERDSHFLRKMKSLKGTNPCKSNDKPKKCIIYAVEMYCKEKKYFDKVNYYVYDEKKFAEIWEQSFNMLEDSFNRLEYSRILEIYKEEEGIKVKEGVMVEPISSMPYRHKDWSYIVFESHLFRVGGSYYSDLDEIRVIREKTKYKSAEAEYYLKEASKEVKEVFENGTWKALPNHPRLLGDPPENDYLISKIVIGAIEEEGFIIAGVGMENYNEGYCFYTYKPENEVPTWEPYISISKGTHSRMMIEQLTLKKAVVSGKLMLWLWSSEPNMLYIEDLEDNKTLYANLVEHLLVPPENIQWSEPVLLMLEKGKFCLFWTLRGSKYLSGTEVYVGLHSTVFTLKIVSEKPIFEVLSFKFSLIPDHTHILQSICIADIEDPMQLTPFDY